MYVLPPPPPTLSALTPSFPQTQSRNNARDPTPPAHAPPPDTRLQAPLRPQNQRTIPATATQQSGHSDATIWTQRCHLAHASSTPSRPARAMSKRRRGAQHHTLRAAVGTHTGESPSLRVCGETSDGVTDEGAGSRLHPHRGTAAGHAEGRDDIGVRAWGAPRCGTG